MQAPTSGPGRSRRWIAMVLGLAGLSAVAAAGWRYRISTASRIRDIGPRLISNQTSQPLSVSGTGFRPGLRLLLGDPVSLELPLAVLDSSHAYARVPATPLPASTTQVQVTVSLKSSLGSVGGEVKLTLVNDSGFPDLTSLARSADGRLLFAASSTTDTVYAIDPSSSRRGSFSAADGPAALAAWTDSAARSWMVVAHQFSPELLLVRTDGEFGAALVSGASKPSERRTLTAPAYAAGMWIDPQRGWAFVAEQARDTISAIRLEDGHPMWRVDALPNPREVTGVEFEQGTSRVRAIAVGSFESGEVEFFSEEDGKPLGHVTPEPGVTRIIGGHTADFARYIMGGKAPRSMVFSPSLSRLFYSGVGPNIGPNPDRMEVSMNGGVSVIPLESAPSIVSHHVGSEGGVVEGLALDDGRGLLYVADIGVGRVRVMNAKALANPLAASGALLQEVAIPPPANFPLIRPASDFGVKGRAGVELHSGPRALVLSLDGRTLYVLNRFSGSLAVLDVTGAVSGAAVLKEQIPLVNTLAQPSRRLGQILYYADLGRSSMSCDTCHPEGHNEGVLFEKTHPMRIYRSTTCRAARDTAPYFNPASTRSLSATVEDVGDRNRFHNPDLTNPEIDNMTTFTAALALLPNPFVGDDGAPVTSLMLPDGAAGSPRRGLTLFEGAAGCAECHPAPLFTTDQDASTRGRIMNVGTPRGLAIREPLQQFVLDSFQPPSLQGAWDVFPMLTSGAGGFSADAKGVLRVSSRFPLRQTVIDLSRGTPSHGHAAQLSPRDQNDLLAYVLSL